MQRRVWDGIQPANDSFRATPVPPPVRSPRRRLGFRLAPTVKILTTSLVLVVILFSSLLLANRRSLASAINYAGSGIASLLDGLSTVMTQPATARASFAAGTQSLAATAAALGQLDDLSKSFLIFPYAREGVQLIRVAYHASLAGQNLATVLTDQPTTSPPPTDLEMALSASAQRWLDVGRDHQPELQQAIANLETMNQLLAQINPNRLPGKLRPAVTEWRQKLPTVVTQTKALAELVELAPTLLAAETPTRYVILFQNNTELRPTGGFIGSYAATEFTGGRVSDFFVQTNVYKADKAFAAQHPITPPYPISEATTVWGMRDANWALDFRDAARQVLSFYQGIHGQPAHGVIAIDTTLITDLLAITGPIPFPEYQTTLTAANFVDTVQYKVEIEYFEEADNKVENEPKRLIADFIPKLFRALSDLPNEKKKDAYRVLAAALKRKSIQIFSTNEQAEAALVALDVAGQLQDTSGDFLYINNANIGGFKSSANMRQEVTVEQHPLDTGIETTLKITRVHEGNGAWPDGNNSNYMRLALPAGVTVKKIDGAFLWHDTTEVNGRTVVGGWFTTPVANKRYAEVTYQLPPSIKKDGYSLLLQKQPGEKPITYRFDSPLLETTDWQLTADSRID